MFDLHKELTTFYHDHVRLKDERKELAERRDLNLDRLNDGLAKLGEDDGTTYGRPLRHNDQGGYAMHTLNKRRNNDYDLDCAIIFRKDDLPSSPHGSRKRIEAAFNKTGVKFSNPPLARTNAVTVWYAEGYHLDFAVYREYEDVYGNVIIEHAGAEWKAADPVAMARWFNDRVNELSPSKGYGATVAEGQMRRVVRWMKAFTKSRDTWSLPGGMIISKLVEESYQSDLDRDDKALYWTMRAIRDRLAVHQEVQNPIFADQKLTSKVEYRRQVERLKARIDEALTELEVLFASDCTRKQALSAWNWVFQHDYWQNLIASEDKRKIGRLTLGSEANAPTFIRDTGTYG